MLRKTVARLQLYRNSYYLYLLRNHHPQPLTSSSLLLNSSSKNDHCKYFSSSLSSSSNFMNMLNNSRTKTTMSAANVGQSSNQIETSSKAEPRESREELLHDLPFLKLASTIIEPFDGSQILQQPIMSSSTLFFKELSEKCSDEMFMAQMNHLINVNDEYQQLLAKLRLICDYNPNFLEFLIYEHQDNLAVFCNEFRTRESLKILEDVLMHYFRAYNQNINGLLTMVMINIIHHSKKLFQNWFVNDGDRPELSMGPDQELRESEMNQNLVKLCEGYDLVGYGIHFHDAVALYNDSQLHKDIEQSYHQARQKIINLLVLIGDHCLVKALSISVSFSSNDLFKCFSNCQLNLVEGESSRMDKHFQITNMNQLASNFNSLSMESVDKILDEFDESRVQSSSILLELRQSNLSSPVCAENTLVQFLIYCHMTGGFQLANNMCSTFKHFNLNDPQAQQFAFYLGQNLGIAIKIFNQLNDGIMHLSSKNNNHNLSDKFPMIPRSLKQYLIEHYIRQSECLLEQNINGHKMKLSDRSLILMDLITRLMNQMTKKFQDK